jgi:hypothetical protein
MSSDPQPPPAQQSGRETVLDYAQPESPANLIALVTLAVVGFGLGVVVTVVLGVVLFGAFNLPLGGPYWPASRVPAAIFGVLLAGSVAVLIWLTPKLRPHTRWFYIGVLIGVGGMSLAEGICFTS